MSSAKDGVTEVGMSVEVANAANPPTALKARFRASRDLRPVEAALVGRYRVELSGNVLEIGSRGDGLTAVLQHHAEHFTGISFSVPEADLCRRRYPNRDFLQRNLVDLDEFDDGQFDAVVAGRYAFDHVSHEQRHLLLERLSRILAGGSVLIFSSHNLASESLVSPPLRHALLRPWRLARLPSALRNRALLGTLQQRSYGYALLNDATDTYSRLSYYVSCEIQERQLASHDLGLVECVDRDGEHVSDGNSAHRQRELYFVARPGAGMWNRDLVDAELI